VRKKVRVRFAVDMAIKGGLVVRIGDTVLDASVRRQLEILRERFVAGDPHSN
jgi:F-type H+-transporting ATPase subunit delta